MQRMTFTRRSLATLLFLTAAMTLSPAADDSHLTSIPLKDIDGKDTSLKAYHGKVLLIVNVASECGYTPQYSGLQALQDKYKDNGFTVLGFPCNDFGGQEPGSAEQIKAFCSASYKVTFPMFEKVRILGDDKHPLYQALTGPKSPAPGDVEWNFTKFLIGKDGAIVKRFDSSVEPESAELTSAIESALAAK